MLKYDKEPGTLEQPIHSAADLTRYKDFPLLSKLLEQWQTSGETSGDDRTVDLIAAKYIDRLFLISVSMDTVI